MSTAKKHGIRDYLVNVLNGMAWGLFSSLLIGLIIKQIGTLTGIQALITFGTVAQYLMAPAIGVGVAYVLHTPALVIMSAATVGAIGGGTFSSVDGQIIAHIGEPAGAFIAALIAVEVGRRVAGKSKVDIVLVPMVTIVTGGIAGVTISPIFSSILKSLGDLINSATELQPLPMGILVAVMMGMILTLPISSAALAIALNLSGLAAGAATVGCCANMIGFAIISYRENGMGGLIAQGIGTSMLQVPNIIRNPLIWLPAIISSAILGPVSTMVFKMTSNAAGAGMGTSGLVGQFATLDVMGYSPRVFFAIAVLHFIAPAIISFGVYVIMRRIRLIHDGDLKLQDIK